MDLGDTLGMSPVIGHSSSVLSSQSPRGRNKNVNHSLDSYTGGSYHCSPSDQPIHSTPIKQNPPSSKRRHHSSQKADNTLTSCSPTLQRTPNQGRKATSNNSYISSGKYRSTTQDSILNRSSETNSSFCKPSYISELEASTVEKQHQELQLLIEELQSRDRELNDMVAAHQRQLLAWEDDRQRVLALEQRATRLEKLLYEKSDELRSVSTKLKVMESEDQSRSTVLRNTQQQLVDVTEQNSHTSLKLRELQEENEVLRRSSAELETSLDDFKTRELDLMSVCKTKDKDLRGAAAHITELTGKLQHLDQQHRDNQGTTSAIRWQLSEWKQKYIDTRKEMEALSKELQDHKQEVEDERRDLAKLRQENSALKKELFAAGERDRRNAEFVELQKSSEDRLQSELATLRQLYERQQRELVLLRINAESLQESHNQPEEGTTTQTTSSGVYSMNHSPYSSRAGETTRSSHSTSAVSHKPNQDPHSSPSSWPESQRLPERMISAETSQNSNQSNSLSLSTISRGSSVSNDSRGAKTVSFRDGTSSHSVKQYNMDTVNYSARPERSNRFDAVASDQNSRLRSKSLDREKTKTPVYSSSSKSFEDNLQTRESRGIEEWRYSNEAVNRCHVNITPPNKEGTAYKSGRTRSLERNNTSQETTSKLNNDVLSSGRSAYTDVNLGKHLCDNS